MAERKCFLIELEEIKIELHPDNKDIVRPQAAFKLKYDPNNFDRECEKYRKAYVKFRAILFDNINVVTKHVTVRINKYGRFSFDIPRLTIGLEVTVKVFNNCECYTKLRGFYPNNCKNDFEADLLPLRLMIKNCSRLCIETTGLDHAKVKPDGEHGRIRGHALGPCRSARAMSISHIALFEAILSVLGGYKSYVGIDKADKNASAEAAVAQATHDALLYLFPSHKYRLDLALANSLDQIPDSKSKQDGIQVGINAAKKIILLRTGDGSEHPEPIVGVDYFPSGKVGEWEPDPINNNNNVALGARWSEVTPFVITSANAFFAEPPPDLNSQLYINSHNELLAVGGDGIHTPTVRSEESTFIGTYYALDGRPFLCAPITLYVGFFNQIADDQGLSTLEYARYLTILNVGLADAFLNCWYWKYTYKFWRPVTAIRRANEIGNPKIVADPNYYPLGAPASNEVGGISFSPPFPAFQSGHATAGGYTAELLRLIYGRDDVPFTYVSAEFNGITQDNNGVPRPRKPRSFTRFSQMEEENAQSRIYLGIHWTFDKEGIKLGNQVADYVFGNLYKKI